MDKRMPENRKKLPREAVFALDIGTRSIIGMVGMKTDGKMKVIAIQRAEHSRRAMIDGQIEDIAEVARLSGQVKDALEEKTGFYLDKVCVAAAGRALKTEEASFETEFTGTQRIDEETVSRLEAGAVNEAQKLFMQREDEAKKQFYLTGYTVSGYFLDGYPISNLLDHKGKRISACIVATFLPAEVVESLYTTMHQAGLEVAALTLEPIAAMNAAIPESLRLLNLVMVDIGAGTSDIAVCRDGKVVGYTMATLAGDEITENIMKNYLVDFDTAESVKMQLGKADEIIFTDILGGEQKMQAAQIQGFIKDAVAKLGKEIAGRILEVNAGIPSAVFMAGGGSRMAGLPEYIAEALGLDVSRISVAGRYYSLQAYSDICELDDPEYATPLGILISAGLNLISDSFSVMLNGKQAKLFSNGTLHISDILMMNGFSYSDLLGRAGKSMVVTLDGVRRVFYGTPGEPAVLRLNETEAKISDLVQAGDNIIFIPAVNGKDAEASAADLFEPGQPEKDGFRLWVNGEPGDFERRLSYGDVVETDRRTAKEAHAENAGKAEPEEADREPDQNETEKEMPAEMPARRDTAAELEKPAEMGKNICRLELNGKPLTLPVKQDGSPYYLMDLIMYAGMDLEHVSSPVILKVNGKNAPFQREIREFDAVEIYEEKMSE